MTQKRMEQSADGCLTLIFKIFQFSEKKDSVTSLPYRKRDSILTQAEQRFYLILLSVLDGRAVVIPKVGLQDIFHIIDKNKYQTARNRIAQRHLDFLVCEEATLRPLFGIELDDKSHDDIKAQKRDHFKNMVFEAGMLPLVRLPVRGKFQENEIKNVIAPYIPQLASDEISPACPKCNTKMIRKTAKHGEFKGKDFFACPNFPDCREIIKIENT